MTTGFGSINLSFLKSAAGWAFSTAVLFLSILMLRDPTADQTTAIVTLIMAGIYFVIFSLRIHGHFRPARQASSTPRDYSVRFDDQCISIENRNGEQKSVAWDAFDYVFIRTTSDGPLDDDIFWIFSDAAGQRLATFPNSAEGCTKLLEALSERLPDFDNQEVIRAMGSTTEDFFVLWRRADRGTTPEVDSATPHP